MQINGQSQPLYNAALLAYAMRRKGFNEYQAALDAKIHPSSVNAALAGNLGTLKKLRRFADSLGVSWKHLFDVDLPESRFSRAVTNSKRG
jgi:hypothetical protein